MRAFCMVLAVSALLVPAALAADQLVPDGTTIQLMLLRQKSVQSELKIPPELAKKIVAFTDMEYAAVQKAMKTSKEKLAPKLKELQKANEKFLADNLSSAQRKRLGQITMQVTGLQQLMRPKIVKALGLTEAQQEKVKQMNKAAAKALVAIIDSDKSEGRNEKLAKLRGEIHEKVVALLTDKQKEIAKEMIGERFKGAIIIEEAKSKD